MNDRMLAAITTAVTMHRGAYTMAEALSYAALEHRLDEFEQEDLPVIVRNQYARLQLQTEGNK